ncbi:glycosyltransferase family 25 protein [Rhizobium rhizogenes]|jgi:glycosyl transferase family 25|uniref:glycosyltransferase family 25 protein n=1 Tax=Rhizobium rhizogenes TaxID=359 RepID=UPI000567A3C1|nr:glycosyltransferase family 25 protein [Rhizobium rhizogenes]NTF85370.1 glycosyltransferase family 25 protein [Rhizobium rhizogenes]NTI24886.1 glycosyltransferase family 25 protein [Rhizobium rhizogenes]NTI78196.1 glycosyltransferase family 25 protein [Rhizobium rhizogenes]QTG08660.1 glycosyltransferase family 25 protein [Rhizobium rhizogenes]
MVVLPASLGVYVINLARSVGRWKAIRSQALAHGIHITRVPAIDGRGIAPMDYIDVDHASFFRHGGRQLLPGEYGCYRSHLRAVDMFLSSTFEASVIIEDDVEVVGDLLERTSQILTAVPAADIVKLFNHRIRGFRRIATTISGDEIGRCLHGPQGSAACYIVTRRGARTITTAMRTMVFPYDVALERGWNHGANVLTVRENIVELSKHSQSTQIGTRADYRAIKFSGARRLTTHVLRALDYSRRIKYALDI